MSVDWSQDRTSEIYEYINRRWVEEFGYYPDGDEPMSIVMVVAIMAEYHAQTCPGATAEKTYVKKLPDPGKRGSLKIPPLLRVVSGSGSNRKPYTA